MGKLAFLYPGQGSQAVGMGKALMEQHPAAKEVFAEADDAVGFKLSQLCFSGPEADLRRTAITQPAILTVSVAATRVFTAETGLMPEAVCGHSLGEYSALVAAGCLSLRDAVRSVHARGTFMQEAVAEGVGAMAAVLGLEAAKVAQVCAGLSRPDGHVVEVANYNGPDQTVISGHKAAVEAAGPALKAAGAKRVMPLPVSAPFHCSLMAPVQPRLTEVLRACHFHPLRVPCVTNVEAAANADGARAAQLLVEQVVRSVRFTECVQALSAMGVDRFVELGPGKVLTGMVKRMVAGSTTFNVEDPQSLQAAAAGLKG